MSKIKAKSDAGEREMMPFIDANEFFLQVAHIVSETVNVLQGEVGFPKSEIDRFRDMALKRVMDNETMQIKCVAIPVDLLREEGIV